MVPLATITTAFAANNPAIGACVVAVLVTGVVFVIARRFSGRPVCGDELLSHSDPNNRAVPEGVDRDRRIHPRRATFPVLIHLESLNGKWSVDGTIMDRSVGGLRVAVPQAVSAQTQIRVEVADSGNAAAVAATVRWCCKKGRRFEVGCEFTETPPWNVLLLFG